jgi:predicted amidohydrolase
LYDLIIKGGLVIDPLLGLQEKKDVAISNGRAEAVESNIASSAKNAIDASNMLVAELKQD